MIIFFNWVRICWIVYYLFTVIIYYYICSLITFHTIVVYFIWYVYWCCVFSIAHSQFQSIFILYMFVWQFETNMKICDCPFHLIRNTFAFLAQQSHFLLPKFANLIVCTIYSNYPITLILCYNINLVLRNERRGLMNEVQ